MAMTDHTQLLSRAADALKLAEAASEGPWERYGDTAFRDDHHEMVVGADMFTVAAGLDPWNAALIAAVPSHVQLIRELAEALKAAERDAARYEYVRCLTPRQFTELFLRNIKGEGFFDALVDAALSANADKGGAK